LQSGTQSLSSLFGGAHDNKGLEARTFGEPMQFSFSLNPISALLLRRLPHYTQQMKWMDVWRPPTTLQIEIMLRKRRQFAQCCARATPGCERKISDFITTWRVYTLFYCRRDCCDFIAKNATPSQKRLW